MTDEYMPPAVAFKEHTEISDSSLGELRAPYPQVSAVVVVHIPDGESDKTEDKADPQ